MSNLQVATLLWRLNQGISADLGCAIPGTLTAREQSQPHSTWSRGTPRPLKFSGFLSKTAINQPCAVIWELLLLATPCEHTPGDAGFCWWFSFPIRRSCTQTCACYDGESSLAQTACPSGEQTKVLPPPLYKHKS